MAFPMTTGEDSEPLGGAVMVPSHAAQGADRLADMLADFAREHAETIDANAGLQLYAMEQFARGLAAILRN